MRKLIDDIENAKSFKAHNAFDELKLLKREPFFVLEAVQLEKA
jgi:hypothetical protein